MGKEPKPVYNSFDVDIASLRTQINVVMGGL